jgi:SpoU rRNA methylase family enzyme
MGKRKPKVTAEGNTLIIEADNLKDAVDLLAPKPYEITSASIKEQKCNYGYEIKTGPTAGDKIPTRKGEAIIHQDMNDAFAALKVHLAIADDAFRHVFDELPELDELTAHEITQEFTVTGFKTTGTEEDEGYFLIGDKYVTLGVMGVDTPKITAGSNYKFFEELSDAISNARKEVELYMNGKNGEEDNQPELPFGSETIKTSADEFDEVE